MVIFLETFEVFRNFPKYYSKVSEVFLEISEIFEMIFEIFRNNSQNPPKYFLKRYEIILKILRNNYRNFRNFLEIFQYNPQNFGNISWNFQKYFWKFSEIFRNNFPDSSKWLNSKNFPKYSKMSKVFVVRSSKRYAKSENWFSQMQSKLVGEIVRNI